jgi:lipoate-protein ligase A
MGTLHYLDLTLPDAAANLALDEALLLAAEEGTGGEVLRFWELPQPAVVLGAGCRWSEEVHEQACHSDGVAILRRSSGGGTVLLGPGCQVYSFVLAYDRTAELAGVAPSYTWALGRIVAALAIPGAAPAGTSDLAIGGRKFSGNSQQRKRHHLLHHGTLLYDFDLASIGRYLQPPPRQPVYRQGRPHEAFLCNLGLSAAELKDRLRRHWQAMEIVPSLPLQKVQQLLAEKYALAEWAKRR